MVLDREHLVWEGTTWPCCLLSPLCCSVTYWKVSKGNVSTKHGCCGWKRDTLDMRRIRDIKYRKSPCCCCCRGTITFFSDDNDSELHLTHFSIEGLYKTVNKIRSESTPVAIIH